LDQHRFDQLLSETNSLINRYFPDYAYIGPTDPAIAINELFCYLFSNASAQLNQITADTLYNFAVLFGIAKDYSRSPEEALRLALNSLAAIERAVTPEDLITVIKRASQEPKAGYSEPISRAYVLAGAPITVFLVQKTAVGSGISAAHKKDLLRVYQCLRNLSPLGARLLIRHAPVLNFDLEVEIVKRFDSTIPENTLISEIKNTLSTFFDPLKGGATGSGWEFERAVSRSEIYSILEKISGVDYVRSLRIKKSTATAYEDELYPDQGGLVKLKQQTIVII
jgi:hypothetical protein